METDQEAMQRANSAQRMAKRKEAPMALDDFEFGQVLTVDEADGFAGFIDDDQVIDFVGLKQTEGVDAQGIVADCFGPPWS